MICLGAVGPVIAGSAGDVRLAEFGHADLVLDVERVILEARDRGGVVDVGGAADGEGARPAFGPSRAASCSH